MGMDFSFPPVSEFWGCFFHSLPVPELWERFFHSLPVPRLWEWIFFHSLPISEFAISQTGIKMGVGLL